MLRVAFEMQTRKLTSADQFAPHSSQRVLTKVGGQAVNEGWVRARINIGSTLSLVKSHVSKCARTTVPKSL